MSGNPFRLALLLAALAVAIAPWTAFAQEPAAAPAAEPETAPAPPEPPKSIPAPEIVGRSEELKNQLRQMEARSAPDAAELDVEAKLPEFSAKLRERAARADEVLSASPSLEVLSDLRSEWRARATRFTDWRLALTRRALAIEAELETIDLQQAEWERTRDSAGAAGLPEATRERVAETLQALKDAEKAIKKRRTSVLALQNDVAQEELLVSSQLERITALQKQMQSRLFARDAPPLWSPQAYVSTTEPTVGQTALQASVTEAIDELVEFVQLDSGRFVLQGVIFVLVFGGLLIGRPRIDPTAGEDPTLAATARIFARPVSAAIVVSTVASQFLGRSAPAVALDAQALILLIPMLRILPRELYGQLRVGVLGLALIFALGTLRSFVSGEPMLERFRLLAETLGGIALYLWLLRPRNADHFKEIGRLSWVVVPAIRIALAFLVVAAIANATGLLSISRLLVRGTLAASFGAVAAYALVRIASGAVTALLRSPLARRLRLVRDHGALVRRRVLTGLNWIAILGWILSTLRFFRVSDDVFRAVRDVVTKRLEVGTVSISLGDLIAFVFTIWLAFTFSRFLRFVLDEDVLPRVSLPRGVPAAISTGIHYLILLLGFVLAIGAAGVDLSRFTLLAGAFGVGIGFGLQNVVNNFVSGLILLFERPVQTGDTIEVGGLTGDVRRIGIRSSTVRTAEGADVIVPNANLISDRVVNWTFADRERRVDVKVGVAYDADPEQVIALLVEAGRSHPEVLSIPEPVAFFTGFGESSLDFSLFVWTRFEIGLRVRSEVGMAVNAALRGAGIEIPYPQRDMNFKPVPGMSGVLPLPPEPDSAPAAPADREAS